MLQDVRKSVFRSIWLRRGEILRKQKLRLPLLLLQRLRLISEIHLECRAWVCAVTRRRFPVGASPTRQPLQPEATGAGMEATKCLKPLTGMLKCATALIATI